MKKRICLGLAAIIAISGIVGYFIWRNNQDPVYLPLDYMYAINLDNGGKVKPGMSREEVEKVFPHPENDVVYIREVSADNEKIYSYRGIDFIYTYDDILFGVEASYAYNKEQEKINRFNYKICGLQFSDLNNISYKEIIEIFGKPTVDDKVVATLAAQPCYVCGIVDDRLRVITPSKDENFMEQDTDYIKTINIEFSVDHDLKVTSVTLYDNEYLC